MGQDDHTAEKDAELYGIGFEVDGWRVHPERVRVFVSGSHVTLPREPTEAMLRAAVGRQAAHEWHVDVEADLRQMRDCYYNMVHAA